MNIKLILSDKRLSDEKFKKMASYLISKFSSNPEHYSHVVFPTRLTAASLNNGTDLNGIFKETKLPIIIITILVIVLAISLGSLLVISLAYSVSICNICKRSKECTEKQKKKFSMQPDIGKEADLKPIKEFDDEETEETEDNISDSNHGIEIGEDELNEKSPMTEKGYLQGHNRPSKIISNAEIVQAQKNMVSRSFRKESNGSDKSAAIFIGRLITVILTQSS